MASRELTRSSSEQTSSANSELEIALHNLEMGSQISFLNSWTYWEGEHADLNQVVDDYGAVPNIGLNDPEESGPLHAQELAQAPCSCCEELGPVAQDSDLADDIPGPGHSSKLQIPHQDQQTSHHSPFSSTNE
jgi:hypothetical protein